MDMKAYHAAGVDPARAYLIGETSAISALDHSLANADESNVAKDSKKQLQQQPEIPVLKGDLVDLRIMVGSQFNGYSDPALMKHMRSQRSG
jgi:hypothetical protein